MQHVEIPWHNEIQAVHNSHVVVVDVVGMSIQARLEEKSNDPIREKNEYTTYSADINFTKKVSKVKPPIVDIDTKVYNIVETNKLIYDDNNIFDILSIDYSTESLNNIY